MSTTENKPSPIEVVLTQSNMQVYCRVVREDESTYELPIDSLSMRGAQREITGYLIAKGYAPVGRWEVEAQDDDGQAIETIRRFKLA
jgi:hypothetical protein